MDNRQQWGTRAGFIMAAMGSAIGLGNIWRFPATAYENGGGAFFLPYLFALLTAGIPMLIMEFTLGHKYRGSAPLTFARVNRKLEWLGWWQVGISFVISTYYSVIIAWALSYMVFSFDLKWGSDTGGFLMGDYLKRVDIVSGGAIGEFGSFVPGVLIPLAIVWLVTLGVLVKGIKKGIELANRIFLPTLIVLFLMIVIRAVTLDGAADGLTAFFKPNWETITDSKVWVAAYSQIFFSLSVGFAIMLTYSSYLPKKSDLNNNAFITGFGNSAFELLAGIGVFSALGFMAAQQHITVPELAEQGVSGIGLAFVVFPQIINEFPAFNSFFGVLFFGSLFLAGISSLISIVETFVASVQDKFNISRTAAVLTGGGLSAVVSLIYATQGGLFFLDVIDYFINNFGIALAGLIEVVAIAWIVKQLTKLQQHGNAISDLATGLWWRVALGVITPVVLGWMMVDNIRTNLKENYGGYPTEFVIQYGWVVAGLVIAIGVVLSIKKWNRALQQTDSQEEEAV